MADSTGFIVKKASYEDISSILDITAEAFAKYAELSGQSSLDALKETEADVRRDIDEKLVLVAYLDNRAVGSLRVEVKEDGTAYLSRFGVSLNCQNLGIGKSLMNLADFEMRERGVKKITLHTSSKISGLVRFYYGRGYYIDEIDKSRGYPRALLIKEY